MDLRDTPLTTMNASPPLTLPLPPGPATPGSVWRHRKTQGLYEVVLSNALIEASKTPAVVYRARSDGQVWVRPVAEFMDGRFEQVDATEA